MLDLPWCMHMASPDAYCSFRINQEVACKFGEDNCYLHMYLLVTLFGLPIWMSETHLPIQKRLCQYVEVNITVCRAEAVKEQVYNTV